MVLREHTISEVEWFLNSASLCWLVDSQCYLSRVWDGSLWFICVVWWAGG